MANTGLGGDDDAVKRTRRLVVVAILVAVIPLSVLFGLIASNWWFSGRLDEAVRQAEDAALDARRDVRVDLQSSLGHVVGLARDFAADPQVVAALTTANEPGATRRINALLTSRSHDLGIDLAWLTDANGLCVAASNAATPENLVGTVFADRQYFQAAMKGVMGRQFAVGRRTNAPGLFFSAPVWGQGKPIGVVALKINLTSLAAEVLHTNAFISDQQGVVILAQNGEDMFSSLAESPIQSMSVEARMAQYKRADFPLLPMIPAGFSDHPEILRVGHASTLAVVSSEDLPVEGLAIHAMGELGHLELLEQDRRHLLTGLCIGLILLLWTLTAAATWWNSSRRQLVRLQQAEEQFRTAFQHAAIGMTLVSPSGLFLEINEALCRLLHYSEAELLGRSVLEVTHPEDVEVDRSLIQDCIERKRAGYQLEKRYIDSRGTTVWALLTVSLLRDLQGNPLHFISQVQDFSERRRAEEALRGYVREIQDLYDHAPCGYHSLDGDGIIVRINDTELRWLGYDWKEVVGHRRIQDMLTPDSRAAFEATFPKFKIQGFTQDLMLEMRRKDGSILPVLVSATAIYDAAGQYLMSRSTVYDMTERKRIEDDLAEAKLVAESASRAKSDFVANMSHEIRTPMNAVLGLTHLLGKGPLAPDQKGLVNKIAISARSLLGIIDEILDFSKIEADRLQLEVIEFDLERVLEGLATVMSINASAKELELIIAVDPDVPRYLKGDPSRLQQIMINLAGNALKFTEQGEVAVQIRKGGDLPDNKVRLVIQVRDSGIGISPEQQARLFSPFTQADATTTRRFGGTGLGLVICKRLAEMMGGSIHLTSRLGEGSEFVVELPFGLGEQQPDQKNRVLDHLHVLVIDDNDSARQALVSAVNSLGWTAEAAASGELALELLTANRTADRRFDLMLADMRMPGLDGLATARRARAMDGLGDLPIVVMVTAFDRDDVLASPDSSLVDGLLLKPVTYSSLFNAVAEAQARRLGVAPLVVEATASMADGRPLDGLRLLLVEDNAINQEVAQFILEEKGASVEIVGDGRQAVDRLRAGPADFDVVLMDVQMPEMDGFEATRLIRGELGLTLPVLALTAGVRDADRAHCLDCGMNDFIAKPFDLEQMVAVILRYGAGHPVQTPVEAVVPPLKAVAPPAITAEPVADQLPVFDRRQGLIRVGDETLLFSLLERLVESNLLTVDMARDAFASGAVDVAAARMHGLRGAAANVAAIRLATRATEAEAAMLEGRAEDVDTLLAEISAALAELSELVAGFV